MFAYRDVTEKSFFRFSITTLGNSKSKYSWQTLTAVVHKLFYFFLYILTKLPFQWLNKVLCVPIVAWRV